MDSVQTLLSQVAGQTAKRVELLTEGPEARRDRYLEMARVVKNSPDQLKALGLEGASLETIANALEANKIGQPTERDNSGWEMDKLQSENKKLRSILTEKGIKH